MATNQDIERQLQNAIMQYIAYYPRKGFAWTCYNGAVFDQKGGFYRKPGRWYRKGVSDINGIWCKRPLFIECKAPKGIVSPEQKEFIALATENGAIAFITNNLLDAMKVLESFDSHL